MPFVVEHGRDERDIGQMRAAERRMIGDDRVAFARRKASHDLPDADAERAEMDRDMRGADHQPSLGIEQCAGKIEPLPDVGGERGAAEQRAHFLDDAHEAVAHEIDSVAAAEDAGRFDDATENPAKIVLQSVAVHLR